MALSGIEIRVKAADLTRRVWVAGRFVGSSRVDWLFYGAGQIFV
jgi:hypothetical protein